MRRITVFCGSNTGLDPLFARAAKTMGSLLASRKIDLVYGGGCIGLMGIIADAALEAGGHVIGVIPEALLAREVAHLKLPDLRIVSSMHERKALMAELSDAFIAMPGGFGTFEEFCEVITWSQLGLHAKPCGLLNIQEFYTPMLHLFDHAVAAGFINPYHRELVLSEKTPETLLAKFESFKPAPSDKWLLKSQT
ncbi:MAG: TIGR00730 family Rossman fold protein [Verrucomicrobiota bacterium]|nr:TIGR00730 family Rossman fold protein [Verrucomicrobiota bacterium]